MKHTTISSLNDAVGGLSAPSKMPCPSWSISAHLCNVGSKLASVPDSICSGCYAKNGAYNWRGTVAALDRRMAAYKASPADWTEYMSQLIKRKGLKHFRWFDSGDLVSGMMLGCIAEIARRVPNCSFWLPTKEFTVVSEWIKAGNTIPKNLTIRLSAYMRDEPAPITAALKGLPSSTVTDKAPPIGQECPSNRQGNKCLDCRACWDKSVPVVSYNWH